MAKQFLLAAFLVVFLAGFSSACTNPQVTPKSFTTQDATIVAHIGFISEFTVQCSSGQVSSLYAELEDGSIIPVANVGPQTFQVSWTEETKGARSGKRNIRIFNEEGYTALRKALRANEPTGSVPEFFSVQVNYPGAYNGPLIRSEFIAAALSLTLAYFALATKARIVS